MGVLNQFEWAVDLVAKELRFRISGDAVEFRAALDRAGTRRFEHCVWLVKNWQRPYHKGAAKYDRLMKLLVMMTPEKVGKYRDTTVEAAVASNETLERELADRLAREP